MTVLYKLKSFSGSFSFLLEVFYVLTLWRDSPGKEDLVLVIGDSGTGWGTPEDGFRGKRGPRSAWTYWWTSELLVGSCWPLLYGGVLGEEFSCSGQNSGNSQSFIFCRSFEFFDLHLVLLFGFLGPEVVVGPNPPISTKVEHVQCTWTVLWNRGPRSQRGGHFILSVVLNGESHLPSNVSLATQFTDGDADRPSFSGNWQ